eukprot:GHVQ01008886.1.p1 GENE.GHVQ01008886.1~~GHVQ01008886.1.p1  ORF type:complete len:544 (-),score=117.83 GHVQ01008886.1:68-1699(-)
MQEGGGVRHTSTLMWMRPVEPSSTTLRPQSLFYRRLDARGAPPGNSIGGSGSSSSGSSSSGSSSGSSSSGSSSSGSSSGSSSSGSSSGMRSRSDRGNLGVSSGSVSSVEAIPADDVDDTTHRDRSDEGLTYPNKGDWQLQAALDAAFREFHKTGEMYRQCWTPFLEPAFIPHAPFVGSSCTRTAAATTPTCRSNAKPTTNLSSSRITTAIGSSSCGDGRNKTRVGVEQQYKEEDMGEQQRHDARQRYDRAGDEEAGDKTKYNNSADDGNTEYNHNGFPKPETATGTMKRVLEEGVIYFGTFAEVAPYAYFTDRGRKRWWGFDSEVMESVMQIFNNHYGTSVRAETVFVAMGEGFMNNVVDALYNGMIDVFTGNFRMLKRRCELVSCGCPYHSVGELALEGAGKSLNGTKLDATSEWNTAETTLGVLFHGAYMSHVATQFSKVTLRLFWSVWNMGEELIRGNIHGAVSDSSVVRFMQTIYQTYCRDCRVMRTYVTDKEEDSLAWAYRLYPAPPELLWQPLTEEALRKPLPNVFSIYKHTNTQVV